MGAVQQWDRGIDYAGLRPSMSDVAKNGASFIMRYSAGSGNGIAATQWKLCGLNEISAAVNAGLDFIANSEWTTGRVEAGSSAGKADGAADLAFWKARGLAKGAAIYVSWDKAQNSSLWSPVASYLEAYRDALGGYYDVGLYAGDKAIAEMLRRGLIRYGWRAMADSWSSDGDWYTPGNKWLEKAKELAKTSPAALVQNGNRWYNGGADEDVALLPAVGSHLQAIAGGGLPQQPAPVNTGDAGLPSYPLGKRVLRLASPMMRGTDVRYWQNFIGTKRCGAPDGVFGPNTEAGVRWYQGMRGIKVDGVIGPQTWSQVGH